MVQNAVSLGFSTYQAGKLFLLGVGPQGRLSIYERTFNRCMGLHASSDANTIWMASLFQMWRMENFLPAGERTHDGYDRLFVPTMGFTTGDIDIHDVTTDASGRPVFCATRFNCIATISETHSFRPLWKPPFVSRLVPEDRCHLNGLAFDPADKQPAFVTMVSRSDVVDGWRDRRAEGGLLMDLRTSEIVAERLSMPHSPRIHPDFPGRVWILNAGTGFFGYVEIKTGKFVEVAFCPGFARGLCFVGRYAVVGLSAARKDRTFQGLELDANLSSHDADARCGLHVIDIETGCTEHWLRADGILHELYDVIALPGVQRPSLLGFKTNEIHRMLRIETS